MDAEQDNTDYGSQAWQSEKLQRIKLRDSEQNDKLLKEVYSGVLNKKRQQMENGASKELWKYWVQYTNLFLIDGILYLEHQTEPNFKNLCQMLVP